MTPILRYGLDASLTLEPRDGALVGQCGSPQVEPAADVRLAVREALAEPLDYPPFSAMVTPGDRVVLAVSDDVPEVASIVAVVVESLVTGRVDPEAITVLRGVKSADEDPCRLLPESLREQVASLDHTPDERESLAYLAATDSGEAVLLHRAIVDADLVLPIGRFRGAAAAGYYGIHTAVYPTFADRDTLRRFRSTATLDARGRRRKRLAREADQVGWLLGVMFTIQVLPAAGDRVHCVLAGNAEAVQHRAMELYSNLWHSHIAHRASLVLAAIEGDAGQQTWDQLGRALETAAALVEPGGGIALCTELADSPGAAVQCLRAARSPDEALARIHQDEADDAVAALQLAHALDHCSVYLLSRLDDALVEDLEMMPVAEPTELGRLAARSESVLLLGNAAYAKVTVDEDLDDGNDSADS